MTLDKNSVYRLLDVLDHQGHSRVESRKLYRDRVGCLATDLHRDGNTLRMTFVRDPAGNLIKRYLHTSTVVSLEERSGLLVIKTLNSVYTLEPVEAQVLAEVPDVFPEVILGKPYEGELIELYLMEDNDHFCKGIYWDAHRAAHSLELLRHMGMLVDSCLLRDPCGEPERFYCRYYLQLPGEVEFYDTLYGQQDYSIPILIHNCGTIPLNILLAGYGRVGTVDPGRAALFRLDCSGKAEIPSCTHLPESPSDMPQS